MFFLVRYDFDFSGTTFFNTLIILICSVVLIVPWFGLQCVIVVYPDHTHFLSTMSSDIFH